MRRYLSRIKRLESRKRRGGTNRVIEFDPLTTTAEAALVGKPPGRYLLAPRFASYDEWRNALRAQQRKLLESNVARPYVPKRTEPEAFVEHEDVLAPGMTKRRALPEDDRPEGGLRVVFKR